MEKTVNEWRHRKKRGRERLKARLKGDDLEDKTELGRNFEFKDGLFLELREKMMGKYGEAALEIQTYDDVEEDEYVRQYIEVKSNGFSVCVWAQHDREPYWGYTWIRNISDLNRKDTEEIKDFIDRTVQDYPIDIPVEDLWSDSDRPGIYKDGDFVEVHDEEEMLQFATEKMRSKLCRSLNIDSRGKRMIVEDLWNATMVGFIVFSIFSIIYEDLIASIVFLVMVIFASIHLGIVAQTRMRRKYVVMEAIAFEKVMGERVFPDSHRHLLTRYEEKYREPILEKVEDIKEKKRKHWSQRY